MIVDSTISDLEIFCGISDKRFKSVQDEFEIRMFGNLR